jgi:pyruvate formate lyase activating enzyme
VFIQEKDIRLDGVKFRVEQTTGSEYSVDMVLEEIMKDRIYYETSQGGATFSGGEPLLQPDFLRDLLAGCRKLGIHSCVDTCGQAEAEVIERIVPHTDLFLYDIKIMDDEEHREYTGASNETALRNLYQLVQSDARIVLRFPLIPGITNNPGNLEKICDLMHENKLNRIDVLPFHNIGRYKYEKLGVKYELQDIREPQLEEIENTLQFFKNHDIDARAGG